MPPCSRGGATGRRAWSIGMRATSFVTIVVLLSGCSLFAALDVPVHRAGDALVDDRGMTLYVFDRDARGKSACAGECAMDWPPLYATAEAVPALDYTLVTRDDGRKQWAYEGKPLYLWSKDQKPGDRTGHGVSNLWRVA